MKVLFRFSIFFCIFSTFSAYASDDDFSTAEDIPLVSREVTDLERNKDYTLHSPQLNTGGCFYRDSNESSGTYYFSSQVPPDRICSLFRAGPSTRSAEFAKLVEEKSFFRSTEVKKLVFYENHRFVAKEVSDGSVYFSVIYCSAPSRELAKKFLGDELRKSQGGHPVDVNAWSKLQALYPDLVTHDMALEFLRLELNRRTKSKFRKVLLDLFPKLCDEADEYMFEH